MKRIFANIYILLSLLVPGVCFTSCINDDSSCPVEEVKKDGFRIHFQIATRPSSSSRAADLSGDLDGSGAENFLNVNDIRYMIFDNDKKFICDISPEAKTTVANDMYTLYDVVAMVDDPFFTDGVDSMLNFYILVLANTSYGWNIKIPVLAPGVDMADVFNNGLVMESAPISATQLFLAAANEGYPKFPMAGLQRFSFHGNSLLSTTDRMPYDTGKSINMLRALAKIEIIDKINIGDRQFDEVAEDNGFRMQGVEMRGYMKQGCLLPSLTQWERGVTTPESQQVEEPTLPSGTVNNVYSFPPAYNANGTIGSADGLSDYTLEFAFDDEATASREDKCHVYSCYVYEYQKRDIADIPIAQQPYFMVKLKGSTDPVIERTEFPMRMAEYTNGTTTQDKTLNNLLRNHIYRFEIAGIGQQLTVNWTVCEMDEAEAHIEFN